MPSITEMFCVEERIYVFFESDGVNQLRRELHLKVKCRTALQKRSLRPRAARGSGVKVELGLYSFRRSNWLVFSFSLQHTNLKLSSARSQMRSLFLCLVAQKKCGAASFHI